MRVTAYASRALSPAEKNCHHHAGKLEFLALKLAVTDHFRDYLYYSPKFTVFTVNNPLKCILTSEKLNATGLWWVNELANFHFEIKYRPGNGNADADTLSRMPINFENYMESCSEVASQDDLDAVTSSIHKTNTVQTAWLSSLTAVPDILKEECVNIPTTVCHIVNLSQLNKKIPQSVVLCILCNSEAVRPIGRDRVGYCMTALT